MSLSIAAMASLEWSWPPTLFSPAGANFELVMTGRERSFVLDLPAIDGSAKYQRRTCMPGTSTAKTRLALLMSRAAAWVAAFCDRFGSALRRGGWSAGTAPMSVEADRSGKGAARPLSEGAVHRFATGSAFIFG